MNTIDVNLLLESCVVVGLPVDNFVPIRTFLNDYSSLNEAEVTAFIESYDIPGIFVYTEAGIINSITSALGKAYDAGKSKLRTVAQNTGETFGTVAAATRTKPILAASRDGAWHFYVFNDLDLSRPGHSDVLKNMASDLAKTSDEVKVVNLNDPLRSEASKANTTVFQFPANNQKDILVKTLTQLGTVVDNYRQLYGNTNYISPKEFDNFNAQLSQTLNILNKQTQNAEQAAVTVSQQAEKELDSVPIKPETITGDFKSSSQPGGQKNNLQSRFRIGGKLVARPSKKYNQPAQPEQHEHTEHSDLTARREATSDA